MKLVFTASAKIVISRSEKLLSASERHSRACLGRLGLEWGRLFLDGRHANFSAVRQWELKRQAIMKIRMTKILRFWVDVECDRLKNRASGRLRTELLAQILRKFEEAGEVMRYLNTKGELAWKATPGMLTRLADAEQEARDDELAEWS
jgi:hypothetical protein